jgi:hypothetical protein
MITDGEPKCNMSVQYHMLLTTLQLIISEFQGVIQLSVYTYP